MRWRDLTSINWADTENDAGGNSTDDTSKQEHCKVDRRCLENDSDKRDQTANSDRPKPAILVWQVYVHCGTGSACCIVGRVERANRGWGKAIVSDEFFVSQNTRNNA